MDYNIHMTKNNHGFTLIELVVTLAVIGILFATAAPDIMFTTSSNRLSTQYNDMRADFAFARNEAVTQNVAVTISSGGNWSTGWTIGTPSKTLRITETKTGASIISAVTSFIFNSDGTANASAPTTFTVCDNHRAGDYGKQLVVNVAGRARLVKNATCP